MIFIRRRVLDCLGSPFDTCSLPRADGSIVWSLSTEKLKKGNTPEADNRYLPPGDQDPRRI
jgi:hypothetical protein